MKCNVTKKFTREFSIFNISFLWASFDWCGYLVDRTKLTIEFLSIFFFQVETCSLDPNKCSIIILLMKTYNKQWNYHPQLSEFPYKINYWP